jgi:hypothetical protein
VAHGILVGVSMNFFAGGFKFQQAAKQLMWFLGFLVVFQGMVGPSRFLAACGCNTVKYMVSHFAFGFFKGAKLQSCTSAGAVI